MPRTVHRTIGDLEIRKNGRSHFYDVPIPIAGTNRRRWISTGCRSLPEASAVIAESGVNRLVHLANAKAVTQAAIQIITAGRKVTCTEVLGSFTCEASGRWSDGTLAGIRTNLGAFFAWARCGGKALVDVDRETILRWVNSGDAKMGTRKNRMKYIRTFYRYARARNFVLENPAETAFIEARKMSHEELEPRDVQPITEGEFNLICSNATPFWRNVTAISYWTGLRFSDCVTLEWASVSKEGLIVWTRKRTRRVVLPYDDPLLGAGGLRTILATAERASDEYVFPEERAAYLAGRRSQFPTAYRVLLDKLGIENKSFHSLRHAAISRFAAAGMTLERIGKLVAHSDPATTAGYIHA